MEEKTLNGVVTRIFGATAGAFVLESLEDMIPWLIAMFFVVLCDFITGCRRSILLNKSFRFSRAWRTTMGKMVTYFSFVVMVVLVEHACGKNYGIDRWSVLFVCFIEGCSIISNLLQPKGYDFDMMEAIFALTKRVVGMEKEESGRIIKRRREENDSVED